MPTTVDSQGHYFIDRDGYMFRHILNFLRAGVKMAGVSSMYTWNYELSLQTAVY